ncbi:MAG: hypothetical protein NTU57_03135 [Candidatus Aenigmarchaeota archaeon]|nr:hypothetical protein [Candidatus Aenigmarchaeota archaeon]
MSKNYIAKTAFCAWLGLTALANTSCNSMENLYDSLLGRTSQTFYRDVNGDGVPDKTTITRQKILGIFWKSYPDNPIPKIGEEIKIETLYGTKNGKGPYLPWEQFDEYKKTGKLPTGTHE